MFEKKSKICVDLPLRLRTCDNMEESRKRPYRSEDEDQTTLEDIVKGHMDTNDAHVL
ncbi:unnamed protein product, partial [Cochlearia groenlandica]